VCDLLQIREAGARQVAWKDEALEHAGVRQRGDDRQRVQRPAAAPVAYPLAKILPCVSREPLQRRRGSPRRHGSRRYAALVRQLPELRRIWFVVVQVAIQPWNTCTLVMNILRIILLVAQN
jgi:hypothetical protein